MRKIELFGLSDVFTYTMKMNYSLGTKNIGISLFQNFNSMHFIVNRLYVFK